MKNFPVFYKFRLKRIAGYFKFILIGLSFSIFFLFPVIYSNAQSLLIDNLNQNAYESYRKNVETSKTLAYQALQLSIEQDLKRQMVDSYINLGRCFRKERNWDSTHIVLSEAISIGEKEGYVKGLMNATNNQGASFLIQGKINRAKIFLQESLKYAKELKDEKGQANVLSNLVIIAESEANFDQAISYLNDALYIYKNIEDSAGISLIYARMAFLFDDQEKNDSAIYYNFKALRIQEALGLDDQRANTYNQIGELYLEKFEWKEALKNYQTALKLYKDIGDISGTASSHLNIGATLTDLKRSEEALFHLEKSIELSKKSQESILIGSGLVNLANWYRENDQKPQLVEQFLNEAIPYLQETNSHLLATAYHSLGKFYLKQNKIAFAKDLFTKELFFAENSGDLTSQQYALRALEDIYRKSGQLENAFKYSDRYHLVKDSLINTKALTEINNLKIQYQTEKKENENLQLQNELATSERDIAEQKALRNLIISIASIILLLGLGVGLWFRYRQGVYIKQQEMELEQERVRKEQRRKEAEKLRELDAMKTRFFTNISHEFRTPLTLILGQNEHLQTAIADKELQKRIEMVDRNGHRLLDLINQVLDVAKLEAGGMHLESNKLDVIPFLKNMLFSFESMTAEKGIELSFESEISQFNMVFDLKKMERILFNLLSNAVKFTHEGGKVRMLMHEQDKHLIIGVADTGLGIKSEQLPFIFDRFYQADSSENQARPGTGIGLALVKELVELHQGKVWVESKINEGSIFWIKVPIPIDLDHFDFRNVEPSLNSASIPFTSQGLDEDEIFEPVPDSQVRVLLVEDNPDVRMYVREQLQSFGYVVDGAVDGIEGLEIAREQLPDLIISDIMMPRMDGYGLVKEIRKDENTSHIPLILLTSKASDESKIKGFEQGIDDYLLKPFNSRELQVRVANLIEQRKRLRERFTSETIIRPNEVSVIPMDQTFLKAVLQTIENNLTNERFDVDMLSTEVGMSISNLNRKLRALVNQSSGKLIRSMRLQRAADLLQQQAATITEIAYDLGFSNATNFARSFKKQFGASPSEYIKDSEISD